MLTVGGDHDAALKLLFVHLDWLPVGSSAIGRSLVFLKTEAEEALRSRIAREQEAGAVKLQALWRVIQAQRRLHHCRCSALRIQSAVRGVLARQEGQRRRRERAATVLRCHWRSALARRETQRRRRERAATVLQCFWRCAMARQERQRRLRACRTLQLWFKARCVRAEFLRQRAAAGMLQRSFRGFSARRAFTRRRHLSGLVQRVWRGHRGRQAALAVRAGRRGFGFFVRWAALAVARRCAAPFFGHGCCGCVGNDPNQDD